MLFTPEIQRDLGEATALLDGDNLLIGNGHWAVVIDPVANFLSEELLEKVFVPLEGQFIDYRILNGTEIDTEANMFRPAMSKKLSKIVKKEWVGTHKFSVDGLYKVIDNHLSNGERRSLTDLFYAGKARAYYPNSDEGSTFGARMRTQSAAKYVFNFDNRVVAISGGYLRSFAEMGMEILCPVESSETIPGMEIYLDGRVNINGAVMPTSDSGVRESVDGRKLYFDAAEICWSTEDDAIHEISTHETSFHPIKVQNQQIDVDELDVFLSRSYDGLRKAVSVLRWNGHPEASIYKLLRDSQYDAWCVIYKKALEVASEILDGDKIPHVINVLGAHGPGSWAVQGAMSRLKGEATTLCKTVEELSDLMGEPLGYGPLPELVRQVDELENECGL
tara:strand:+ start:19484 stop:20656 length:1173 start_codon:yes stop_codon:yes gene_type:complete